MRTLALLVALPSLCLAAALPGVPEKGADAAAFAPAGWAVELTVDGELDGDGVNDLVVVLLAAPREGQDRVRALLWLHGVKGGGFVRVASNVGLLACFQCLGAKGGDGAPDMDISEKGVLSVSQWGGSRESYGTTHKFRCEKDGAVKLIGLDEGQYDSLTGEGKSTSKNFLTGAVVESKTGEDGATKKTQKKVKPALQSLADVMGYGARP